MTSNENFVNIKVVEIIDVQLIFWSSFHLTKFEKFKFWISVNGNLKQDFETLNDFK